MLDMYFSIIIITHPHTWWNNGDDNDDEKYTNTELSSHLSLALSLESESLMIYLSTVGSDATINLQNIPLTYPLPVGIDITSAPTWII